MDPQNNLPEDVGMVINGLRMDVEFEELTPVEFYKRLTQKIHSQCEEVSLRREIEVPNKNKNKSSVRL